VNMRSLHSSDVMSDKAERARGGGGDGKDGLKRLGEL
jgi:hypothetical protein